MKQTKSQMLIKEKKLAKKELKRKEEEWKKTVKERDNYQDQITMEALNGRNCHVHHVLDKKNFPELRFDVMNGLVLSYRNHKVGKYAPHMNALWFSQWFKTKFPERYHYLLQKCLERGMVI